MFGNGKIIGFISLTLISIGINVIAGVLEKVMEAKKRKAIENSKINNDNFISSDEENKENN